MDVYPTKKQLDFLSWKFGIFFHFGIRTFYQGHKDWDGVEMSPDAFCPTSLDCEQWVREAKAAGATYTILTTKHHDGFALWPSKYTKYNVSATPWKNGKGDVVAEYVAACRKYGMKVGLYYSPAQWGESAVSFSDEKAYDDYFLAQLSELLTGYGKIDYLWFDGNGSAGHQYDRPRIMKEIYRMQPDILTFCEPEWETDTTWVGNEDGYADTFNLRVEKAADGRTLWFPTECDCSIRTTWFCDKNEDTIKAPEVLLGMYESSVGHGSNFLLNVGPDARGLLSDADLVSLRRLGELLHGCYDHPVPFGPLTAESDVVYSVTHPCYPECSFYHTPTNGMFNRVLIKEDLTHGQNIRAFRLYARLPGYPGDEGHRQLVYEGRTVGAHRICVIPTMYSAKLEVEVTESDGIPHISAIEAYMLK